VIAKLKRTRLHLALAGGGVVILMAAAVMGISHRWFRGPYPSVGKQIAWRLGYPEAGYNFDAVVAGKIYRSGSPDEGFIRYVHAHYGVRRIVSLAGPLAAHETARRLGIRVTVFSWTPSEPPPPGEFRAVLDLLEGQGPVLVHCSSGSDRTGYAIVTYRVLRQNWSLAQAVEETKKYWHNPALYPKVHAALAQFVQQSK
jgi:hypothetical protein